MAALAEYEAKAISDRTKAALGAAKARGTQLGGRRWAIETVAIKGNAESAKVRTERTRKRAADLAPIIAAIQAEGAASLRQIADGLNGQGVPDGSRRAMERRTGPESFVCAVTVSSPGKLDFRGILSGSVE